MNDSEAAKQRRTGVVMRLKRVEGQVRAIQRMINDGEGCDRVAQQMSASRAALDKAFFAMISCAMDESIEQGGTKVDMQKRLAELSVLIAKFG